MTGDENGKALTIKRMVRVGVNKREGQIVGIWTDITGVVQYRIRYADNQGVIRESWLNAEACEPL